MHALFGHGVFHIVVHAPDKAVAILMVRFSVVGADHVQGGARGILARGGRFGTDMRRYGEDVLHHPLVIVKNIGVDALVGIAFAVFGRQQEGVVDMPVSVRPPVHDLTDMGIRAETFRYGGYDLCVCHDVLLKM